jgi:uncharacterized repeat protein (TIGR03809 family)
MPLTFVGPTPAEITLRGRELAERRRAHLIELYDSGRWALYYTEEQLVARMRDATNLVETWKQLARNLGVNRAAAAQ